MGLYLSFSINSKNVACSQEILLQLTTNERPKNPSCNNLIITYILTVYSHDRSGRSTNKLTTNMRTIIHQYAHPILTKNMKLSVFSAI